MLITTEVSIFISNKIISYYRNLGYNIKPNDYNNIKVEHLLKKTTVKVNVECDICSKKSFIAYQKYTKNVSKYNFYSCLKCSRIKVELTLKETYGSEKYVNIEASKKTIKERFDKITLEYESNGFINCIKCSEKKILTDFEFKKGRYKHICKACRNLASYKRKNKYPHVKIWRQILRNYLMRTNGKKKDKTINLLKYTALEFQQHMNSLFTGEFSWDNYGEWHVDHIVHLSFFKESTPIHIVNGLDNLRPLKASQNLSRRNYVDKDFLLLIDKYKNYIKEEYLDLIVNNQGSNLKDKKEKLLRE